MSANYYTENYLRCLSPLQVLTFILLLILISTLLKM